MARTRRKRLSWFRFYVDDFRGGVEMFSCQYVGQYVRLLCAQWDSKEAQCVPADLESLSLILREEPHPKVLAKFDEIEVGSQKFLRNKRLAEEWADSKAEYEGKSRPRKSAHTAAHSAPHTAPEPEPEPDSISTYLPTARARAEARRFDNPADDQTEREIRKLQNELGGLLANLAEHHNSRLMVPAWCKRVTRYGKGEGVADYRTIRSIGRLEKSIEDAKWWLSKLESGRIVDGAR